MRLVVDENIPWAADAFAQFGDVVRMPGRAIANQDLLATDALIVRSVTNVDQALLQSTPVRFVGTATIGVDHVDQAFLAERGIAFASAAGSNARSVAEYVIAALLELRAIGLLPRDSHSLGVVGVGDIGGLVSAYAGALGLDVHNYDPPRAAAEPAFQSVSLEQLLACRAITLHLPLTQHGEHATHQLFDRQMIARLRRDAVLVNSSRGAVVDSEALLTALVSDVLGAAVLDVWEGEPDVPDGLIGQCAIATPHIAGYATDAKLRGTTMMVEAVAAFLGVNSRWNASEALPALAGGIHVPAVLHGLDAVAYAVRRACPVQRDDAELRTVLDWSPEDRRAGFDRLRKNYPVRREFSAFRVDVSDPVASEMLSLLGFDVVD